MRRTCHGVGAQMELTPLSQQRPLHVLLQSFGSQRRKNSKLEFGGTSPEKCFEPRRHRDGFVRMQQLSPLSTRFSPKHRPRTRKNAKTLAWCTHLKDPLPDVRRLVDRILERLKIVPEGQRGPLVERRRFQDPSPSPLLLFLIVARLQLFARRKTRQIRQVVGGK